MLAKLGLLLKSKVAIAAIGALLVAGAGVTAVGATTGGHFGLGPLEHNLASSTSTTGENEHNGEAGGSLASGTATKGDADDTNENDSNEANETSDTENEGQELTGSVQSVDTTHSSFVLQTSDGTHLTVSVSSSTTFDGGIHSLADLKAGAKVVVKGAKQSDGSVAATSIQAEDSSGDTSGSTSGSGDSSSSSNPSSSSTPGGD